MAEKQDAYESALKVAQLYYYHDMNTPEIADELDFSRAKVSRLLNYARSVGLVEIRIIDRRGVKHPLVDSLKEKFRALHEAYVLNVPEHADSQTILTRVGQYAAAKISNDILTDNTIVGISWGRTLLEVSSHLVPRPLHGVKFVQLHGNGFSSYAGNAYGPRLMRSFSEAFEAELILFPVPEMFQNDRTRETLWQEPAVQKVVEYQKQADVLLFSIGSLQGGPESFLQQSVAVSADEIEELVEARVVGHLATMFFREDGSAHDVFLNKRSTGPDLDLFRRVRRSVCVVAGQDKVVPLHAALKSGYISDLFIDERTAQRLVELP